MSNFDLIDDYLAGKLSKNEQAQFDAELNANAGLKAELDHQRLMVEGIRKARMAEIKAMLNNVEVPQQASLWGENAWVKIAATIGVAGLLISGLYYFNQDSGALINSKESADVPLDSILPSGEANEENPEPTTAKDAEETTEDKNEGTASTIRRSKPKTAETTSPKVDVNDPSQEIIDSDNKASGTEAPKPGISLATIQVERDTKSAQYAFHYQFKDAKLFLFGPFDQSLYEILEVHGDKHALFLFFKDSFYYLDEAQTSPKELVAIRDRALLQKLKEFRSTR